MLTEFTTIGVAPETIYGTFPTANKQLLNVQDVRPTRTRNQQAPPGWSGDRRTFPLEILDEGGQVVFSATALQYENFLSFHEQLMGNARGVAKSVTALDISATSGTITTVGAVDFSPFEVGDMLYLDGAIGTNLPEFYGPVLSKTATTLVLATGVLQLANFSAGSNVRIRSRRLIDGVTESSIAFEAHLTRLTNQFLIGEGYKSSLINWAWQMGQFATEEVTLQGQEWSHASATAATGSIAAKTTGYMKGISPAKGGVGRIFLADGTIALGAPTTLISTQWGIQWKSTLAEIKGLGSDGPTGIDEGGMDSSMVTANVRFDDTARTQVADQIDGNVTMQSGISVRDKQGNRMFFFSPAAKPTGDIQFGRRGTTVFQPLNMTTHDPAKDVDSIYNAAGFGYQHAIFYVPFEAAP